MADIQGKMLNFKAHGQPKPTLEGQHMMDIDLSNVEKVTPRPHHAPTAGGFGG